MNELRPSRDLLDHTFNGYKLSLAAVPIQKLEFTDNVDVVEPSEDQYSFLHQREFSLHNHLHSDPWHPMNIYFIDKLWNVKKMVINENSGRPQNIVNIFSLPQLHQRSGGEFNVSLLFPTQDFVIIGDGYKNLHIIEAKNRSDSDSQWKLLHSENIFEETRPFHIMDATCSLDGTQLHCILLHVEPKDTDQFETDKIENKNSSKYETVLQWVSFKADENKIQWVQDMNEELRGCGKVEYVAFENGASAIYVASQHKFKFPKFEERSNKNNSQLENGDKVDYYWQQNFDDIHLYFDGITSAEEISVNIDCKSLVIKCCSSTLLCGTLSRNVNSDLTTWSLKDSRLEIVLQKSESGTMWQKLISDPKSSDDIIYIGKEIVDPDIAEDISSRLSHLTSNTLENGSGLVNDWQLEECDAFEEESTTLFRFIPDSPEPSHKILIGGAQWLFILRTCGGAAPSMCIRTDVDGCIWKPSSPDGPSWPINHIGTFLAFGYILASKLNRKFTVAPADLSYVSVVDNTGHVIIYRQGVAISGELRNRKTHEQVQSIATQSMVNLQTKENILGSVATSSYLFILTTSHLHLVHIV